MQGTGNYTQYCVTSSTLAELLQLSSTLSLYQVLWQTKIEFEVENNILLLFVVF